MTDEAMVEAVARALCLAGEDKPDAECVSYGMKGRPRWEIYRGDALAAIRALAPLIVEQCAEVAGKHAPKDDEWNDSASSGCRAFLEGCKFTAENTSKDIRALIQKEASDGER